MATVLIVDDALFMRQLIRKALEGVGFTVVGEAGDGEEALALCTEHRPDLVTLDIVMPGMDGIQCLETLRQDDKQTQVIMITAVDQRDAMLKAMRLGVADFVVKPFTEDRIVSAAEKVLGRTDAQNKES